MKFLKNVPGVNFLQICSNFAPGVKFDPAPGVTKLKICWYKAYFVKTLKIFLSITIGPRATKFGI